MKEPDKIIAFIMSMPQAEIDQHKKDGLTVNIDAPQPLAFYSVYRSITLGTDGQLRYHRDIYKRDKAIFDALKKEGKVPVDVLRKPPKKSPKKAAPPPLA